jgi:hypothetical protein
MRLLSSNTAVCFQGNQFSNPEEALEIYKQHYTVVHKERVSLHLQFIQENRNLKSIRGSVCKKKKKM